MSSWVERQALRACSDCAFKPEIHCPRRIRAEALIREAIAEAAQRCDEIGVQDVTLDWQQCADECATHIRAMLADDGGGNNG